MKIKTFFLFLCLLFLVQTTHLYATEEGAKPSGEKNWAIGMVARLATIPFATQDDRTVGTLIPLFYYEGETFYLRGTEMGFRFYSQGDWQFSLMGRMHFFDIPKQYQNEVQGDNVDWGLQAKYQPFPISFLQLELLSDWEKNISSNARLGLDLYQGGFHYNPYFEMKLKSNTYNSYYFGLNQQEVKAGIDWSVGIIANYHVLSNMFFYGAARLTLLDRKVRDLEFVDRDVTANIIIGVGFANEFRANFTRRRYSVGVRPVHRANAPAKLPGVR